MYSRLVPLQTTVHADLFWVQPKAYGFAQTSLFIPITPMEVISLMSEFPVVFGQTANGPALGILTGFEANRSLAIGPDGRWRGSYIPAALRAAPFAIAAAENDTLTLLIDEASSLISRSHGQPILGPDRAIHPSVQPIATMLVQWHQGRAAAAGKLQALVDAGLLAQDIKIASATGNQFQIEGVRVIRQDELDSMAPESILALHRAGALGLAYLAASSLAMLERLGQFASEDARQKTSDPSLLGPEWFG